MPYDPLAISRRGNIVANNSVLETVSAHCPLAFKVKSFDNSHSPKTQRALCEVMRGYGFTCESIFDAAHGRRYMLFIYAGREGRKACFEFVCAP